MRNKKPVEKHPIHVKSGDKVVVTSGKDKGKVSSVKKVITSENKVDVEGAIPIVISGADELED
jgi:ribosomal protein L24